ncbi:MAG: hypothetical protein H7Z72_08375 [Bacteroidetes bacterium]|nr:hypothetical protein [Fibrella sp.]
MENFTTEQLLTLAQHWRLIAQALNEYQAAHWANFSVEQHLDVNAYQNSLLNRANDLETGQIRAIIHDALPAYTDSINAIICAAATLRRSNDLAVGLNVGAMTVALAAAVARGHLKSIEVTLRELNELRAMG